MRVTPRRAGRLLTAALASIALCAAAPAAAAGTTGWARPDSYTVPGDDAFPEGIARHTGTPYFYVGSTTDGTVYRGHVRSEEMSEFLPGGADGRTTALGMKVDRFGRLIVAGGATGSVWVYSTRTGELLHEFTAEHPEVFLNDVVVAPDGDVYVTDSFQPYIYRIGAEQLHGRSTRSAPLSVFADLHGTPVEYQEGFNVNGIAATPDGRYLLIADANDSALYRVPVRGGEVVEIDLGEDVVTGDGLLLRAGTLYAVSRVDGNGAVVNVVRLRDRYTEGELLRRVTDPGLLSPSTAAFDDQGDMLVVNFQFGATDPELPFTVSRLSRWELGSPWW
ncbi:SMP-30/gluconolactonase/LRE family protein [Allonocardiopsis opalescens]|uniref:Sugar lactone lactonase YvrE n=1 Tax=Allonocardiopsis opalescens TaxID=1144618 RepID=A0A2T0QAZ3_9ACTN|nr:SMP-30/gluconolactonase/LRE family protein [Allonocardiopsis opalescens]PRY01024.1 sugar lactone lactonase YvrE [Allonocardiopsis opalescens]